MILQLLSSVVKKAQTLPEAIQDELAEQLLEDIENEIRWRETISSPQNSLILVELAQKAINESKNRETQLICFDEL